MYHLLKIGIPNSDNNQVVPQVENMGAGYDWDASDSITHLSGNVPLFRPPNFRAFHLDPDTKLTDIVSQAYISTRGILASDRICRVLDDFIVQRHERYPADVVLHGKTYRYCWLHMIEEVDDRIDFAKSEFYIETILDGTIENVALADKKALGDLNRRLIDKGSGRLRARRITFISGTPAYDLFCLQFIARAYLASEALTARLSATGQTGFEFRPAETEVVFSDNRPE
jgi:hypothetical protein